jgi:hypothetical protein
MSDTEQSTTNSKYTAAQLDLGLLIQNPSDDLFEQSNDAPGLDTSKQDFNKRHGPSKSSQPQIEYNIVDNDDLESIHGDKSVVMSDKDDDFPKASSDEDDRYEKKSRSHRRESSSGDHDRDRDRDHDSHSHSRYDSDDDDRGDSTNMRRKLYMKIKLYCRKKKIDFPSHLHSDSPYSELKAHLSLIQSEHKMEQSVEVCKKVMVGITSVFEFLNTRFDPLSLKLDGWSEQVNDTKDEYDEVFEELYEKHADKVDMPAEVRLMLMIGGSAASYHVQNSMMGTRNTQEQTVYQAPQSRQTHQSYSNKTVSDPRNDEDTEIQNIIQQMKNQNSDTASENSIGSTTSTIRRKRGNNRVSLHDL